MSKTTFYALVSGKQVTIHYNGVVHQIVCGDAKEADILYGEAVQAKAAGGEKLDKFGQTLSPDYRIEVFGDISKSRSGVYYLKDSKIPIPNDIVKKLLDFHKKGFPIEPIMNFTEQLLLNPDKHVRHSLFKFAEQFNFPITDNGYFIAYKSVIWRGVKDKQFGLDISSKYVNMKSNGKDPSTVSGIVYSTDKGREIYFVENDKVDKYFKDKLKAFRFGDYDEFSPEDWLVKNHWEDWKAFHPALRGKGQAKKIKEFAEERGFFPPDKKEFWEKKTKFEIVETLDVLFNTFDSVYETEVPEFTDLHTRQMSIKLGKPVTMPRNKCDNNPRNTCSRGLHVGAPEYVSKFGGGDTYIIACLVSPRNVVAVPDDYDWQKMRCCEYYPYAIAEFDNSMLHEIETPYFETDYCGFEKVGLEQELKALGKLEGLSDADIEFDTEEEREASVKDKIAQIKNRLIHIQPNG